MKNKILATIQDVKVDVQEYLNYCALLSKEYNMKLDLIASTPEIYVDPVPEAIVGSGISHPTQLVENKVREFREKTLQRYVENLKVITPEVQYNLELGDLEACIYDDDLKADGFMWTVNRKSDNGILNQLFGTEETLISKQTELPALVIPDDVAFRTPKTLMVVLKSYHKQDFIKVNNFASRLNLNLIFAYYAEDGELNTDELVKVVNSDIGDFGGIVKSFAFDHSGANLDRIMTIEQPDWLAFMDFDSSFIERFYKINTNQLILSSNLPVVIF